MTSFDPRGFAVSPYAVPVAVTTLLMLTLGAYVMLRRFTRVSVRLFTLTGVVGVWLFSFIWMYSAQDAASALFWARLAYLGVPLIAPAAYHFSVVFLRIDRRRRFAVINAWLIGAVFSGIAVTTDLLIPSVTHYWWGFYPRYRVSISIPFLLFFFGYLAAALAELLIVYRKARGAERGRLRTLIVAFGIAYLGVVDFLPKYGIAVYPFGYATIFCFVVAIALAVRRYDLVPLTPQLAARDIIGTMADVLFVCDREGRIQFANRAASRLLGFDEHELAGRYLEDLMTGDAEVKSKLKRTSIRNAEYVFVAKNGDHVELTLSIAPVTQDAAGAVIIGRDMRDRKRAEREVLQAVTLLQSTLESTADGILVVGDAGRIVSYNQRFVEMWRLPQKLMDRGDDRAVLDYVLDQVADPEEFLRSVDNLYAQTDAESFDLVEFKDGRRFERYSIGRKIEDFANVRVWSFRDVTARFVVEAALRESEIRYRLLFEQNAAGVCVTRSDGTIVDCNTTFSALVGRRRADTIGHNLRELYARPMELEELIDMLSDVSTLNSVEVELQRADGSPLWVLQNLVLVGDGPNAVVHATVVDISDRKRAEEQIEFHAYHDVLTHLPNRKLFTDRLRQSLTRARRSTQPLAVMFIDIDHFKTINDTLGHTAGDELLLEMSRRLRRCVRDDDTVARLGGDEFTILLGELRHPEDAVAVAQKVLDSVQVPLSIHNMPIEVTASIGISLYPNDGVDAESLIRNADSAMYRAKESGRNNYQLCTDEMKRQAMARLSLESRLRRALNDGQLVLRYQPQVNLVSGRIIGAEALVRWNDPERGLIEPDAFIPTAEESRLIIPLGEWVLRTACEQSKHWQKMVNGHGPFRVGVNLSARQFQQLDLTQLVRSALSDSGLEAGALELEITETTAMRDADLTVEVLRSLRDIGVGISIDDFGTGYSSLGYLKRFPINAVKIDRAFVRDIVHDDSDAAIVSAVIGIARSLRLRVVAEGVETAEQFALLHRKQCDEAQGYYFSRPITAEELTRAIAERRTYVRREPRLSA